jgi:hypothetical protein
MRQLDFGGRLAVIELARHLPVAKIELPLRATVETRPIRTPTVGKRAAHVRVPATEYSRHETAYLCHMSPRARIALVCITRRGPSIWATKRHTRHKTGQSPCDFCASLWPFLSLSF